MRRGEIWTLRDDNYASKARPVVVVQSNTVNDFDSVILALLTTFVRPDPSFRVQVDPSEENGLRQPSYVMVEKLATVRRQDLGMRIGSLTAAQMREISQKLAAVLAITSDDITDA